MEWDQFLFYQGWKSIQKIKKIFEKPNPFYSYSIELEFSSITKYLNTILQKEISISISNNVWQVSNQEFILPHKIFLLFEEESSKLFLRLLLFYLGKLVSYPIISVHKPSDIYKKIYREYNGFAVDCRSLYPELRKVKLTSIDHYNSLMRYFSNPISILSESSNTLMIGKDFKGKEDSQDSKKPKDSLQKLNLNQAELLEVDEKKIEEYTLGHNFEKIETVEEFDGNWRDIDGEEDMEEEEALGELNLKHVIRTEDPVHTTRSLESGSGTSLEITTHQPEAMAYQYPEWDYKKKDYKLNFCTVYEESTLFKKLGYAREILLRSTPTTKQFLKKIQILFQEKRIQKRLKMGSDIDLDALISRYADIKAKKTPSEEIYTNHKRDIQDISIYFCLDISLSTDSFIEGKRILDVERESILIFCESLDTYKIPFGIGAFYSRTHNQCKFLSIKNFHENWIVRRDYLGALSPTGYTRIGPALRHSISILKKQQARQKWIVLLTDARPNDYDQYEGKYGIEDVNKAVREASLSGIHIHGLAIGKDEKPTIPAMMREASFRMLLHPEKLTDSLGDFFRRVLSQ
ncbi:MAG: VWA domain-containing protein [Leptospiraceae bacterium]|nr:VWA domain-containing protein [Leptospiraceae bacterium]